MSDNPVPPTSDPPTPDPATPDQENWDSEHLRRIFKSVRTFENDSDLGAFVAALKEISRVDGRYTQVAQGYGMLSKLLVVHKKHYHKHIKAQIIGRNIYCVHDSRHSRLKLNADMWTYIIQIDQWNHTGFKTAIENLFELQLIEFQHNKDCAAHPEETVELDLTAHAKERDQLFAATKTNLESYAKHLYLCLRELPRGEEWARKILRKHEAEFPVALVNVERWFKPEGKDRFGCSSGRSPSMYGGSRAAADRDISTNAWKRDFQRITKFPSK